jgi:DNA-binding MarR family transcriptional regulator
MIQFVNHIALKHSSQELLLDTSETTTTTQSDETEISSASIQTLLGRARNAYASAIHSALLDAEMDDLPLPARTIIGRISRDGTSLSDVLRSGDISRQHGTQLMDILVQRGYVVREPDPDDRRRMRVALTERGQAAAEAIETATAGVDASLTRTVTPEQIANARVVLTTLANLAREGVEDLESDEGFRRGRRRGHGFGHRPHGPGEGFPERPDWGRGGPGGRDERHRSRDFHSGGETSERDRFADGRERSGRFDGRGVGPFRHGSRAGHGRHESHRAHGGGRRFDVEV